MTSAVHIIGRFPPPIDGQTMATELLATSLAEAYDVRRFSVSYQAPHVQTDARFEWAKVRHYLSLTQRLRTALAEAPSAPVLWTSVSPMPLGHWRDMLTILPALRHAQRVYAVVHWGNFDRVFRSPLTAATARWMTRRLAGFVFLPGLAERCAPWVPAGQRFEIPNTVNDAVLCSEAAVQAKWVRGPHRPFRLLYLSNMIASKGYLDVLDAVRLLHARGVPVRADFVGGWMEEADRLAFEQQVAASGLNEQVMHHGSIRDQARVGELFLDADVFVLPTYYPTEAQPRVLIEALNAGTPVVTTRHASIPHMVRDGLEARFVPPRQPAALADAVHSLREPDVWQAASRHARQRFLDRFSPEAVQAAWIRLIEHGRV